MRAQRGAWRYRLARLLQLALFVAVTVLADLAADGVIEPEFSGSIVGILLGAWLVLHNQRQNHRHEFSVELFRSMNEHLTDTVQKLMIDLTAVGSVAGRLRMFARLRKEVGSAVAWRRLGVNVQQLVETHQRAVTAVTDLPLTVGAHEIVAPALKPLAEFIAERCLMATRNQFSEFLERALVLVPLVDVVDGEERYVSPLEDPTDESIETLASLAEKYTDACVDVLAYATDLSRELQVQLLGDVFERDVPRRDDPEGLVLSSRADDLARIAEVRRSWKEKFSKEAVKRLQRADVHRPGD